MNISFKLLTVFLLLLNISCVMQENSATKTTDVGSSNVGVKVPDNGNQCSPEELIELENSIKSALASISIDDVEFSFLVMSEDGREIKYERGNSKITDSFESASTSKWPTATIILSFMESVANQNLQNRLSLASKPQDFFGIESTQWPIEESHPLANMTLKDLLSFTSGLSLEPPCITPGNGTVSMETCVRNIALANKSNGKTPGTEFFYSGSHLQVAGLMAVKARDRALGITTSTWQDLFNDFKTKTGLFLNSSYDLPSTTNPRLGGGMHWTGTDYLGFLRSNYRSEVLSPSLWDMQRSDQILGKDIGNSPALSSIGEDWHYGLGLWLQCHSSKFSNCQLVTSWASPGTYGSFPFIDLENKFYGIIAREGSKGSFDKGYAIFEPVSFNLKRWSKKDCPPVYSPPPSE